MSKLQGSTYIYAGGFILQNDGKLQVQLFSNTYISPGVSASAPIDSVLELGVGLQMEVHGLRVRGQLPIETSHGGSSVSELDKTQIALKNHLIVLSVRAWRQKRDETSNNTNCLLHLTVGKGQPRSTVTGERIM